MWLLEQMENCFTASVQMKLVVKLKYPYTFVDYENAIIFCILKFQWIYTRFCGIDVGEYCANMFNREYYIKTLHFLFEDERTAQYFKRIVGRPVVYLPYHTSSLIILSFIPSKKKKKYIYIFSVFKYNFPCSYIRIKKNLSVQFIKKIFRWIYTLIFCYVQVLSCLLWHFDTLTTFDEYNEEFVPARNVFFCTYDSFSSLVAATVVYCLPLCSRGYKK